MNTQDNIWRSTALEINLERTKAVVEIPDKYRILLDVARSHYGVSKRTEELLVELNHPFVNWEYVLNRLKGLSIGDFFDFNMHEDGLTALKILSDIYFMIISSASDEDIQDSAIRYFFEYFNALLSNSNDKLSRNTAMFPFVIQSLLSISLSKNPLLKKSSSYIKTTVKLIVECHVEVDISELNRLLSTIFQSTYLFWLTEPDPAEWFSPKGETKETSDAYKEFILPLSHQHMHELIIRLKDISQKPMTSIHHLMQYLDMPDYVQIMNGYLLIADELERSVIFAGRHYLVKLDFLFNIINISGLSDIHSSCLIEINRCLGRVLKDETHQNINDFIRKIFRLLKKTASRSKYQNSIIDCVTTLAKGVFEQNNHALVDIFMEELVAFGFQYPDIQGSTTEWQIHANPAHVRNIRSWLEIISLKPRWTKKLLSALIINLKLKGVFIRDTDLLQKDITGLLNSDILPAYNLVKQLLRIFPIYFQEIGAEGELREISTNVDELSRRNDKLIYFLRKQSHVESNSLLIPFIEDIFRYWNSGDKSFIKDHLPDEVYHDVKNAGEYYDGLHIVFKTIFQIIDGDVQKLLEWDNGKITREIKNIRGTVDREKERARLMIRFYQLIYKKYFHQHIDLLKDLEASCLLDPPKIRSLKRALDRKDHYKSLVIVMDMLSLLKTKILSPQKTEFFENIYYKRHIAAGIPSMYGTYHEEKFEATGLTLRLESLAMALFEKLIEILEPEIHHKEHAHDNPSISLALCEGP